MIKDKEQLIEFLLGFLKQQMVIQKKKGALVHLDGTLMSLVNLLLVKRTGLKYRTIAPITNQNKYASGHLALLAKELGFSLEFKDLAKDFEMLALHQLRDKSTNTQILFAKRFCDLALNLEADQEELAILSNLCYSQWIVGFPHQNYQAPDQIHLLFRLFYSEVKDLAYHLGLNERVIEREPSFYLWNGQRDLDLLGFSYQQLESFLRSPGEIKNEEDLLIGRRLIADNRNKFTGPLIQRPSNLIG